MSTQLTPQFLDEIFKLAFTKKPFLEIVIEHLKYTYIPKELSAFKFILQSITNQYSLTGKLPSYGICSQQHQVNSEVQSALSKIKAADIIDTELALKQLFSFIRDVKFQIIFEESHDLYNDDKKEDALKMFMDGAEELANFSLKSTQGQFMKVFGDHKQKMREKQQAKDSGEDLKEKVPFGIDILDIITDGGIDTGDTALWIMRSGIGKSTALKHTGMYCARLGYNVLHIQCEGTGDEAFDKYTQIWTGTSYNEVKWANIPREKQIKIDKVLEDMSSKQRDLEIYPFEKFGMASMTDVRNLIIEYHKVKGAFPDLIIIDSLDLLVPGTNKKIDFDPAYKKDRYQGTAQLMKNIAVEFKTRILTATQTSDVPKEKWNNPDWCITRENTEADKTLVKPFSNVFTGNQTVDERKKDILRLHVDKLRNYDVKDSTYPIHAAYNVGKFYDKAKTLKDYSYMYEDK